MNSLEIALIIMGTVVIIISCLLVDKSKKTTVQTGRSSDSSPDKLLSVEDKKQLKIKVNELISEVSEDVVGKTEDTLSKISNENIIVVNEFSEQLLEKINRNHEEVIFLYNMLNDKEKELKTTVREIDAYNRKAHEILESNVITEDKIPAEEIYNLSSREYAADLLQELQFEDLDKNSSESRNENSNDEILSLYSQGKSVVEISKALDLGQGEVKLVIDLFNKKN